MRPAAAVLACALLTTTGLAASDEPRPGWFDLPIRGGIAALAAFGIPPEERALTLPILARAILDRESRVGIAPERLAGLIGGASSGIGGASGDRVDIPAPLSAEVWRTLLALAPADDVFVHMLRDRQAFRLAAGLMETSDSIRELVTRDRDLLRFLYRDAASAFAVVADNLRLDRGRFVVPGGAAADEIWKALAGASPSRPAAFLRALLLKDEGRLAWYFDTIAGLDAARLAAAWPSGSLAARRDNAHALYEAFRDSDPQWRIPDNPAHRNVADPAVVLTQSDVTEGSLAGPATERFWELVFSKDDVSRDDAERALRDSSPAISMTWLARAITLSPQRERRNRFEVFRLAQRVFRDSPADDHPALAAALNGHRRFRALVLALERMQITSAATWATLVDAADYVSDESDDTRASIVAFQAAIGLVERIRHRRALDAATADRVLTALAVAVRSDRQVTPSIARWITATLVPALPPLVRPDAWTRATAYESTILQALAGPADRPAATIEWEGLTYKVDVVAAEHARLRAVRRQLRSPGLDAAIAGESARDLAAALTTLSYAAAAGDPDGPIALSPELPARHDLGLAATSIIRDIMPWTPPEERQGMGPWRVQGSLIGLDLGLSRLLIRRVADQQMPAAPKLTLNDLTTLARTIVAMVPTELVDADRDELAAAIARGRARVAGAGGSGSGLAALAVEVKMSAVARQVLPWVAARQPEHVLDMFSLRDLLWLGRPLLSPSQLDRWGVAAEGLDGRRTLAMPPPAPWEEFAGRSEAGQMATQVPDITLRLVEETARLRLPASLVPSLLAYAIGDYFHDVQIRFADDWWRMTRQAKAIGATRIEDYVAALAGTGALQAQ
jgi:hypothetical protein